MSYPEPRRLRVSAPFISSEYLPFLVRALPAILSLCFLPYIICAQQQNDTYARNKIIIKLKAGLTPETGQQDGIVLFGIPALDRLNSAYKCTSARRINNSARSKSVSYTYVLHFEGHVDVPSVISDYVATGVLQFAEPDYIAHLHLTVPDDTYFFLQWGLNNNGTFSYDTVAPKAGADIKMECAWDIEQGDSSIIVAVIDAGAKLDHPEFAGRIWKNYGYLADSSGPYPNDSVGWNFVYGNNNPADDMGHGTNVAGIIGANGNNAMGYAGVDWHCKLMILKVADSTGSCPMSDVVDAINYATDKHANVMNLSLGSTFPLTALQDAIDNAYANNITVVAAMGNSNTSAPFYPAACNHVIAVGATTCRDWRAPFSNFGPDISVVAPGEFIFGCWYLSNTDFTHYESGTSQATPLVTGVSALLLAQDPGRTPDQIMAILDSTAQDTVGKPGEDVLGWDPYMGWGRINACKALSYCSSSLAAISGPAGVCTGSLITLADATSGGTWSSGSPAVATIGSLTGIVTGVSVGTSLISYTVGASCRIFTTISVFTALPAITGPVTVCAGQTITLSDAITGGTWVSNPLVAAVGSSTGIVTGISGGTTAVTYSVGSGCSSVVTVRVNPLSPISGVTAICAGSATTLTDGTAGGTWSGGGSVSIGSATGMITGITPGTSVVNYTLSTGCTATTTVDVITTTPAITGITTLCDGLTITLADAIAGGTWMSAGGLVTVGSGTGTVTGVSTGTAIITYFLEPGCMAIADLSVISGLPVIGGSLSICAGSSATLTESYPGGSWSSTATDVTVAGSTGLVTGVSAGTAIITYTAGAGCDITATVVVHPISGITGTIVLSTGLSVTLSDATTGGTWSSSNTAITTVGSTTGVVTGGAGGTVTITYTTAAGCTARLPIRVYACGIANIITTVAGDGATGDSGDGGPGTAATINLPWGVAADPAGNIYFADLLNAKVRKINPAGIISTIAGTGTSGFSGDGGAATLAHIDNPIGVAIDQAGNVIFVDNINRRVRKVTPAGIITTIAGIGSTGYGGDGGPATLATFGDPHGLCLDTSGNIYIADAGDNVIRKINTAGMISTVAGTGVSGFGGDGGPATDAKFSTANDVFADIYGNLFVADYYNYRIRKINSLGIISTIAGNGSPGFSGDGSPATIASMAGPGGLAVDYAGNVYSGDPDNHRVRLINSAGIISTIAGNAVVGYSGDGGPATAADMNRPDKVTFDGAGNLYVTDGSNQTVRKISIKNCVPSAPQGNTGTLVICSNSIADAIDAQLAIIDYNVGITDVWSLFTPPVHGTAVASYSTVATGGLLTPAGLSYTPNPWYTGVDSFQVQVTNGLGSTIITIYITVNASPSVISGPVLVSTSSTITLTDSTTSGTWNSSNPGIANVNPSTGVVIGVSGGTATITYTVGSCFETQVVTVSPCMTTGIITTIAGTGTEAFSGDGGQATAANMSSAWGLAVDGSGNVYFSDFENNRVRKITTAGIITTIAGNGGGFSGDNGPATAAGIDGPTQIVLYGTDIYVAEVFSSRVRKINAAGIITTYAGNGIDWDYGDGGQATAASIANPNGLGVDLAGNIYVPDQASNDIRKITPSGIISTIAGIPGTVGYTGDGGPATLATMNLPTALATDAAGNVYVSDFNNNVVRKISTSGIITRYAGSGTPGFTGDGGPATLADLRGPAGIQFDMAGNLYISDANNNRVRMVNTAGIISTIAGTGVAGFFGDGGAPLLAELNNVNYAFPVPGGDIYISDMENFRLRKITYQTCTPIFSSGSQNLAICNDSLPQSINALLAITDVTYGLTDTWSLALAPVHGTAVAAYTATSSGGLLTPSGLSYTPAPGYSGTDSFKVQVTNGLGVSEITIYVTVSPMPGPITGAAYISTGGTTTFSDTSYGGTWSSGNTAIAVIGSSSGTAIGISPGVVAISYTMPTGCYVTTPLTVSQCHTEGIISTIAGNGVTGGTGDGGPATAAEVNGPSGVIVDSVGNVYFADLSNNKIRKVSSYGIITTIAGTGFGGYGGDNGPATLARINEPNGIVMDRAGNIYFADNANSRLREINTAGVITTFAGTGTAGYTGDGGPATLCRLNRPNGLAIDLAGNIYFGDYGSYVVRKISSGIITTIAGTGTSGFSGDGGPATDAELGIANEVVVDPAGNVYVSDYSNNRVRKISTSGIISTVAGNGIGGYTGDGLPATSIALYGPGGVALDASGNLYIGESNNHRVRKVSTSGIMTTIAGTGVAGYSGDGGPATLARLNRPNGVAVDRAGNIFTTDGSNQTIRLIGTSNCGTSMVAPDSGSLILCENSPAAPINSFLAVTDYYTGLTVTWSLASGAYHGAAVAAYTTVSTGGLLTPSGLTYTPNPGYSGPDSFQVVVTDGLATATIIIRVNVIPLPDSTGITGPDSVCVGTTMTLSDSVTGGEWYATNSNAAVSGGGLVNGINPGTDTIYYSLTNACGSSIQSKTITVLPLASVGVITGPSTVCLGASIVLTDTAHGGTWSSTNGNASVIGGTVLGISAGTDTIKYGATNSCGNTIATLILSVIAPPDAGVILGQNTVCAGSLIVLSDTSASGVGTWSASNAHATVIGGDVTGASAGVDTITYSVSNACGSAYTTATVLVIALPVAGNISGPGSVCVGAHITLTDAATGGAWSSVNTAASVAAGTVTGLLAGTDIISYAVTNACGTAAAVATVTIPGLPDAGTITGPAMVCTDSVVVLTDIASGGTWSTSGGATVAGGTVTGVTTGTAIISYTVISVCGTALATHSLVINLAPVAGTISGPASDCVAASVTLIDPATGGTWISANTSAGVTEGSVTGIIAGTDIISYLVVNSCGMAVATATVTVKPVPYAGTISGPGGMCNDSVVVLTDGASGGTWISANTTASVTGGTVTGLDVGTDVITYVVSNSCGTAIASHTLAIQLPPDAGTISAPGTICVGSYVTVSDPAIGGFWTSANAAASVFSGLVSGISVGTDIITYTVTNLCGTAIATASLNIARAPGAGTITGPTGMCFGATIVLSETATGGTWSSANTSASVTVGTVTGLTAGTDVITYSVSNLCGAAIATHTVTISNMPDAGIITGPDTVCLAASILLTDPATGGDWSRANANALVTGGLVSGLAAGTDIISYVVTNACGTAMTATTIAIEPLPFAGSITGPTVVCQGSFMTLTDTWPGGAWSSTNTNAGVIAGVVTGNTPGLDTVRYSVTNSCGTAVAPYFIDVVAAVHPGAISGPKTLCAGASATLTDTASGGAWQSSNTAVATINPSSGVVSGAGPGTAIISYTVFNLCDTLSALDTISVSPVVTAGVISSNHANAFCVGDTFSVADAVPGGVWSISNTVVAALTGRHVRLLTEGPDTIYYTVMDACDTATAAYPFFADSLPPILGDLKVCVGDTVKVGNEVMGGTYTGGYPVAYVGTSVSDSGIIAGLSTGTGIITYQVDLGCRTFATVTVVASPDPGTISGAPEVCRGAIDTLSETDSGGTWTSGNTAIAGIGSTGIVNALAAGTTVIVYTTLPNSNNCISTTRFPITVTNPFTIAGTVTPASCYGGRDGSIETQVTGGTGKYTYSWTGGFSKASLDSLVVGFYVVQVRDTATRCTGADSFEVTQPDSLVITATINNDTCKANNGSILTSVAGGTAPYQYLWSNNATGKDIGSLGGGTYQVTVTDAHNCNMVMPFVVVDSCATIFIPDVITPNGDGYNDVWVIRGLEDYPKNTVQVFDKWGTLVYEKTNYTNEWGGKGSNGDALPDGTYFYLVKLNAENGNGSGNVFTGAILIKR